MTEKELPHRWKAKLKNYYYTAKDGTRSSSINLQNFSTRGVEIHFEDGSHATFKYAFFLEMDDEVAVFTEHCGYHLFYRQSIEGIRYL